MTTYEFGEIVLIGFPQTGTTALKKRPGLVILDIGDADLVLAPITTRERSGPGDRRLWLYQHLSSPLHDSDRDDIAPAGHAFSGF